MQHNGGKDEVGERSLGRYVEKLIAVLWVSLDSKTHCTHTGRRDGGMHYSRGLYVNECSSVLTPEYEGAYTGNKAREKRVEGKRSN